MTSDPASPSAADRPFLRHAFGNHRHWVDMDRLWGEAVLPGSVLDMLHLCREGGVRGNVNFDGVVEVGGSCGQPYGRFQGGDSSVRPRPDWMCRSGPREAGVEEVGHGAHLA